LQEKAEHKQLLSGLKRRHFAPTAAKTRAARALLRIVANGITAFEEGTTECSVSRQDPARIMKFLSYAERLWKICDIRSAEVFSIKTYYVELVISQKFTT
jgi:hypothetical protein